MKKNVTRDEEFLSEWTPKTSGYTVSKEGKAGKGKGAENGRARGWFNNNTGRLTTRVTA